MILFAPGGFGWIPRTEYKSEPTPRSRTDGLKLNPPTSPLSFGLLWASWLFGFLHHEVFFMPCVKGFLLLVPRWGHPGQQQGRRFPFLRSGPTLLILESLVSSFLASSIQQSHSLRASGVMSSHKASASLSASNAVFKSAGTPCATPLAIFFMVIGCIVPLLEWLCSGFARHSSGGPTPCGGYSEPD